MMSLDRSIQNTIGPDIALLTYRFVFKHQQLADLLLSATATIDNDIIHTIGFDADDTLWHSETYFSTTEDRFRALLEPWCSHDETSKRLLDRERSNLSVFGYGIKGFTLSMVETAIAASDGAISTEAINEIISWGKEMLEHPVELIDGVEAVLDAVGAHYRLVLLTKGDLFHQESKIAESGLAERFAAVDVMAEKDADSYGRVLARLGIDPAGFLMVGNSVRSDVLPILELGGQAVHVPYAITWGHEKVKPEERPDGFLSLGSITEVPALLGLP